MIKPADQNVAASADVQAGEDVEEWLADQHSCCDCRGRPISCAVARCDGAREIVARMDLIARNRISQASADDVANDGAVDFPDIVKANEIVIGVEKECR